MKRYRAIHEKKNIALVAHDNKKDDLLEWVEKNSEILSKHNLFSTGTTGKLIQERLYLPVTCVLSGPLGGDQQLGAMIAEQKIDMVIFFCDPMEPLAHDSDVKAFQRLCVVWNTPLAMSTATADFILSSPFMEKEYQVEIPDYAGYLNRKIKI